MTKPNSTAIPPHDFYVPREGDSAAAVAEGYDNNFQTLDTSKADAEATLAALDTKVDKVDGAGLMTDPEREKLEGVEAGANAYSLPVASAETLGGIMIGRNLTIAEDGTVDAPYAGGLDPDSLPGVSRIAPSDRFFGFGEAGDPQTATAQQFRDYAAEGLASAEQVNAALDGKFDKAGGVVTGTLTVNPTGGINTAVVNISELSNTTPHSTFGVEGAGKSAYIRIGASDSPTGLTYHPTGEWNGGKTIWHSGNLDPATVLKWVGEATSAEPMSVKRNGYGYNYSNDEPAGGSYISFGYDTAYTQAQLLVSNEVNPRFHFRYKYDDGTQDGAWAAWRELWHSGNFDPVGLFRSEGYIDSSTLNNPEMAMIGNKASVVSYGGHAGLLVSFSAPASGSPLQFLVDQYQDSTPLRWRHGIDNNRFGNPNFRTIYDTGNLGPATASADGLMAAADKQKLDALPPKIIAGSVYGGGGVRKGRGFSAEVQGNYIRVTHNLGHANYIVTATVFAAGNTNYADNTVATIAQTANDFELSVVSVNGSIERCTVDFILVCV